MRRIIPLLLVAMLGSAAVAQPGQQATTNELERLSPRKADAIIRRDLLSILRPTAPVRRGMFRRLRGVSLMTRAYGTAYRGVCGRDSLTLWYAPSADHPNDPDAPLTPYSVTSGSSFHIASLVHATRASEAEGAPERAGMCRQIADDDAGWFGAETADLAVSAAQALDKAVADIRRGALTPDCAGSPGCRERIVAGNRIGDISRAERCTAAEGRECYRLTFGDSELTLVTIPASDGTVPLSVVSARYDEVVVVT